MDVWRARHVGYPVPDPHPVWLSDPHPELGGNKTSKSFLEVALWLLLYKEENKEFDPGLSCPVIMSFLLVFLWPWGPKRLLERWNEIASCS